MTRFAQNSCCLCSHACQWLAPLLLCAVLVSACHTTDSSGTGSMASVYVTNNNSGVVRGAAIAVFEDNGYKLARRDGETLVFEKQASKMNDIAYGNWTESRVWDRVKVRIQTLDETLIRLSCTGYLVRDKGGPTEEEVKPYRRTPYQKLLEQVGARLGPVKTSQP